MMSKPNKLLGQNWLTNPQIHESIITAGEIDAGDKILEIGPGTGLLTAYLAQTGAQITAVEKDPRLAVRLLDGFKNDKNVTIIEGDILKDKRWRAELTNGSYKAIGNIPYYLTSRLIRRFLDPSADGWPQPILMVFMVQKEVAQRIVANPPEMSLLALAVQFYAQAKIIQHVPKENFRPAPRVNSAIIKIVPQALPAKQKNLAPFLFKIARAGFAGKRKQLLNSLVFGLKLSKIEVEGALTEAGINGQRRPETLSLPEWLNLSSSLSSHWSVD